MFSFFLISVIFSTKTVNLNSSKTENASNLIETKSLEDIKILAIVANGFGDAYFWVKTQFEQWGCNFTTAGLTQQVSSCSNYPPIVTITSDILVSEITSEIITQFDCVYIPAGGHWVYLDINPATHNVLEMAYEEGLVVSAICIGTRILARAGGIVDGVKVVYYQSSYELMLEAGAKIVYDAPVVSDKRIVTAMTGTCGYVNPNIYAFCTAIAKAVLGLSAIVSVTIEENTADSTNFSIAVEVTDLSDVFYGNDSTDITQVRAFIYPEEEDAEYSYSILTDEDEDNTYTGSFSNITKGRYTVEINVKSAAWGMEVVTELNELTLRVSGYTNIMFLFTAIFLGLILKRKK